MATAIINRFENNFIVPDFSGAEYNPGTGYYTNVYFPYENKDILKEVYDYYHDGVESISLFHCVAIDGAFLGDITINREVNIKKADERMLELWFSFAGIDYIIKADLSDVFSVEGSTYRRYYNENKGVIYYSLESPYEGDVTKKCGLTSDDLDNNVYFLRGNDIASIGFDEEEGTIKLIKLNGDVMKTEPMDEYISSEVQKDVEGVVDEIMCEISGVSETLTELIEDEKNERIGADTAINESITNLSQTVTDNYTELDEKKTDKEEFDQFVETLNNELTSAFEEVRNKFDDVDNSITQTNATLQQEQTARVNKDNELDDLIDKTCMRVYRDGYNMNNSLWYGHYFGCSLGRPAGSVEGETYALTVLDAGTLTKRTLLDPPIDCSWIINNTPSQDGWNGCSGTYPIGGLTFAEWFNYDNYAEANSEICKTVIKGLPNGTYTFKIYVRACSTKQRDTHLPETNTTGNSFNIKINNTQRPNEVPTLVTVSIGSLSDVMSYEITATVVENTLTITLLAGEENTANWFVVYLNSIYCSFFDDNFTAIKQVCQSDLDNNRVFQRLIYTKNKDVYESPVTLYGEWEKTDEALSDYYTSAQTDSLLATKQDKLTAGTGIEIANDNTINCTLDIYPFVVLQSYDQVEPYLAHYGAGGKIALVPNSSSTQDNIYDEYIWVLDQSIVPAGGRVEKLGEYKSDIDLTDYYTSAQTDNLLSQKQPVGNYVSASTLNDYYTSEQTANLVESAATIINQTIEDNEYTISVALNDLNERLSDVYTTGQVNEILEEYTTFGDVEESLGDYYTTNEVDSMLENYCTIDEVGALADDIQSGMTEIRDVISENEFITASSLNDLNSRINEIDAKIAALIDAIEEIRGGN